MSVTRAGLRAELLASDARYGGPDDPIYRLSPVLHEAVAAQHERADVRRRAGR